LPQAAITEVAKRCGTFLRGNGEGKKELIPVAWNGICCSKNEGALDVSN